MTRRWQADIDVQWRVMELAPFFGPAQIHRKLFPYGPESPGYISEKTVQRMVRELRPPDTSGAWAFMGADPEDAELILDVACYVFIYSEGRVWLTQGTADFVLRVRRAAPSLPTRWAWWLAHTYQLIAGDPEPDTRALDLTLGTAPWTSEDQAREWRDVLRCGNLLARTDERVIGTLEALAHLEGWPPLTPADGPEPAAPDDAAAWYEPNPDAAGTWQRPAPATAPPTDGGLTENADDAA